MASTSLSTALTVVAKPKIRPGVTSDSTLTHIAGILGYTAFFLMAATVIWGILLATRMADRQIRRQTLYGGHLMLTVLALGFAVMHAQVQYFRHDVYYTQSKILLPWLGGAASSISAGILGLEVVVVVTISIWFQHRMNYRRWRWLHWLSYPGFVLIAVHSAVASREQHFGVIWAAMAAVLFVALVLTVMRVLSPAMKQDQPDQWFDVVEEFENGIYRR
ncbi:Ferric reductase domain protein protein transmembrane component domain protein [Frankia canadensis]|uniref:Ferric reductase domain protein protein transmembrane component domain protein n=1 Tax=Frankia canadensis TaxID=1836972 RepID=A0A2I2KK80_9ACTN|nr:ferric reductase-like transmembrane domain-containing protein [Frankia canadensis]SNQ46079.1 Ferric reductase domain protein protein transmembrane component domain protein [Frankia canadensis]SOU53369.1 Ferric reductase domain protein protein transmembrane component domain protein [Frankia canadensis]